MIDQIDNHLSNLNRSKPTYNSFRYDMPNEGGGVLHGDGNVIDAGQHAITHIIYDFTNGTYTFFNEEDTVYTCTRYDDQLNVPGRFACCVEDQED